MSSECVFIVDDDPCIRIEQRDEPAIELPASAGCLDCRDQAIGFHQRNGLDAVEFARCGVQRGLHQ